MVSAKELCSSKFFLKFFFYHIFIVSYRRSALNVIYMIHPRYFLLQAQPFSLSISTNIIFILFHFRSYFSPIIPGKIIVDYPYSGLLLVPSYFQSEKSSKYFIFSGHLFFGSIKTHLSSAPKPLQVFSYGPWDIFLFSLERLYYSMLLVIYVCQATHG